MSFNTASFDSSTPSRFDPAQWHQAIGLARQSCARIFRDGGTPTDALRAFGITASSAKTTDWSSTVDRIAETLCTPALRRAA